jgi:hypothetical protein
VKFLTGRISQEFAVGWSAKRISCAQTEYSAQTFIASAGSLPHVNRDGAGLVTRKAELKSIQYEYRLTMMEKKYNNQEMKIGFWLLVLGII